MLVLTAFVCLTPGSDAQTCRLSVTGMNRARKVTGAIHAECPEEIIHSAPFGNWGVSSNYGSKHDGHQFDGWCHNSFTCDNSGRCKQDCLDGWYEWNSCTDNRLFTPPNCTLYNANGCTEQVTVTGTNVHGSKFVDVPVRCPIDSEGDGIVDQGGCKDVSIYASGRNFMSLYELDPICCDELVQTVYFPETTVGLTCDVFGCAPADSNWVTPAFYDSPASPAKVYAELATAVNWGEFLDNTRACRISASISTAVNAASYTGPNLAPESIATVFGQTLSPSTISAATVPLPTSLGGIMVQVTDSAGAKRLAPLYFVSPRQINFQAPAGSAVGAASIAIIGGDAVRSTARAQIESTVPGIFTAAASGQGPAAAVALKVDSNGAQTSQMTFRCDGAGNCTPNPIDIGGASDRCYLVLFGTGIRRNSGISTVGVTIAGENARVLYAGPQPQFAGLDQVNVEVPFDLRGRGQVDVIVSVASKPSNPVKVTFQ